MVVLITWWWWRFGDSVYLHGGGDASLVGGGVANDGIIDVVPTCDGINADIMKAASTVPIIKLSVLFH